MNPRHKADAHSAEEDAAPIKTKLRETGEQTARMKKRK